MQSTKQFEYKLENTELDDYRKTVKYCFTLADKYFLDLVNKNRFGFSESIWKMPPIEFFEFVKAFPYQKDFEEYLNRPGLSIQLAGSGHPFDCDDRAILSLAFFNLKNFLAGSKIFETALDVVGRKNQPHHIFCSFRKSGEVDFIPFDCTYPVNEFGKMLFEPGYHKRFFRN